MVSYQFPPFQGSSDGIQMCSTCHLEPVDNRVEATTHRSIHMEDVALCFLVFFIPAKQSAAFKKKQLG